MVFKKSILEVKKVDLLHCCGSSKAVGFLVVKYKMYYAVQWHEAHSQCCTIRHCVQSFVINFSSYHHIAFRGGGRNLHSPQQGGGLRLLKHGASFIPSFNKCPGQRPQAMPCSRRWKCNSGHYSLCPHGDSRLKKKINHIRQCSVQDEGMSDKGTILGQECQQTFSPCQPSSANLSPPSVNFLILPHLKAEKYHHSVLCCIPLLQVIIFSNALRGWIFFYVNCRFYCLRIFLLLAFGFCICSSLVRNESSGI